MPNLPCNFSFETRNCLGSTPTRLTILVKRLPRYIVAISFLFEPSSVELYGTQVSHPTFMRRGPPLISQILTSTPLFNLRCRLFTLSIVSIKAIMSRVTTQQNSVNHHQL